jgi:choline dehydrogenase
VHGVTGLYVADASIMPGITRGNINLPTAMIGARVATKLLDLDPAQLDPAHLDRARLALEPHRP